MEPLTKYSLVVFQQQKFVLRVLEAEKSKLKEQVILVPSKVLPCLFTLTPVHGRGSLSVLFNEDTNPIHKGSTLGI